MEYLNNSVKSSVWIGTSLLAYGEYIYLMANNMKVSKNSFWFNQSDILRFSQRFSKNKIQSARVSQWYNGDHHNSSYNYLKSNGAMRRVTARGEFNLNKEIPTDLNISEVYEYEYKGINIKVSVIDLIKWIKEIYSKYFYVGVKDTSEFMEDNYKNCKITNEMKGKNKVASKEDRYIEIKENIDLYKHIYEFMNLIKSNQIEVYNEISFQHEVGIYLRKVLDKKYKIQFERNVTYFNLQKETMLKKEMDIVIFNKDKSEKYCIELKYPTNGQYPEQMFSICKDIRFLEQLIDAGFSRCYSVNFVTDKVFYNEYKNEAGIYEIFRKNKRIEGVIAKPTGNKDIKYEFKGSYDIKWNEIDTVKKFFIVEVK